MTPPSYAHLQINYSGVVQAMSFCSCSDVAVLSPAAGYGRLAVVQPRGGIVTGGAFIRGRGAGDGGGSSSGG